MKNIEKEVQTQLVAAMKAKDDVALTALRQVKSSFQVEKTSGKYTEELALPDDVALKLVMKQCQVLKETKEMYENGQRMEQAALIQKQIDILTKFLPVTMTDIEIREAVKDIFDKSGLDKSIKSTGKLITMFNAEHPGQQSAQVGLIVRSFLTE